MSRPHITIAQSMAVVLYVGFGFAALRTADALWASVAFSLAILTVSVALAGACSRKVATRMPWAGFAAAGGLRLVAWLSAITTAPPPLVYSLGPYINPDAWAGGPGYDYYVQISNSFDVILLGCCGAVLGRLLAAKDKRPHP